MNKKLKELSDDEMEIVSGGLFDNKKFLVDPISGKIVPKKTDSSSSNDTSKN